LGREAMDFSTGEGRTVKEVRVGMRSRDGKVDSLERKKIGIKIKIENLQQQNKQTNKQTNQKAKEINRKVSMG
jgi:hypothetical protein